MRVTIMVKCSPIKSLAHQQLQAKGAGNLPGDDHKATLMQMNKMSWMEPVDRPGYLDFSEADTASVDLSSHLLDYSGRGFAWFLSGDEDVQELSTANIRRGVRVRTACGAGYETPVKIECDGGRKGSGFEAYAHPGAHGAIASVRVMSRGAGYPKTKTKCVIEDPPLAATSLNARACTVRAEVASDGGQIVGLWLGGVTLQVVSSLGGTLARLQGLGQSGGISSITAAVHAFQFVQTFSSHFSFADLLCWRALDPALTRQPNMTAVVPAATHNYCFPLATDTACGEDLLGRCAAILKCGSNLLCNAGRAEHIKFEKQESCSPLHTEDVLAGGIAMELKAALTSCKEQIRVETLLHHFMSVLEEFIFRISRVWSSHTSRGVHFITLSADILQAARSMTTAAEQAKASPNTGGLMGEHIKEACRLAGELDRLFTPPLDASGAPARPLQQSDVENVEAAVRNTMLAAVELSAEIFRLGITAGKPHPEGPRGAIEACTAHLKWVVRSRERLSQLRGDADHSSGQPADSYIYARKLKLAQPLGAADTGLLIRTPTGSTSGLSSADGYVRLQEERVPQPNGRNKVVKTLHNAPISLQVRSESRARSHLYS
jgi:hypothetical protein